MHLLLHFAQLDEEFAERHAITQRLRGSRLDDGSVGKRVAEGDSHFHEIDSLSLHGENNVAGALEGWCPSAEIKAEQLLFAATGKHFIDFVGCHIEIALRVQHFLERG